MSLHNPTPRLSRGSAALALITLMITTCSWSAAPAANASALSRTISPTSIDWGRVQRDADSAAATITVTNTSSSPLTVSSVTLTGPDSSDFRVDSHECTVSLVGAGQYCRIFVQVTAPHEIGTLSAALVVIDDATPSGQQIPLAASTWYVGGGSSGEYFPVPPVRVVDSRKNVWFLGPIYSGTNQLLTVSGSGVPVQGVSALALNVTTVNSTNASYLTLWPDGRPRPTVSSINTVPGSAVANFVIVQSNGGNSIDVYLGAGSTDLIIDVVGYFGSGAGFGAGTRFHPVDPFRMIDSRDGTGPIAQRQLAPGETVDFDVRGAGEQLPPSGILAVALNVTAARPTAARGYFTVFPGNIDRPDTSNVNFTSGATVPNVVIVEVPADGTISFFNSAGSTDLIVDVIGYFDSIRVGDIGRFAPIAAVRSYDTRLVDGRMAEAETRSVQLTGIGEFPAFGGVAVMNLTIIKPTAKGYAVSFSDELCSRPNTSNVNFIAGRTVAGAVWSSVGDGTGCSTDDGRVAVFNSAGTPHVALDVFGFFFT